MFVTSVCDGGAKKRTRTVTVCGSCKSSVGPNVPLRDPVYELENNCQVEQAFISSVQIVSFVGVFAAG